MAINPVSRAWQCPGTKIPCYIFDSGQSLAEHVARIIASLVRERNALGRPTVLGLPTGSTPVGTYRELARLYRTEDLDLSNVITFNLDEYFGLASGQLQSYHRWMQEHLFTQVNIAASNIHIPDGMTPLEEIDAYCRDFEDRIRTVGGIDLQLLGIGRNGHIGFNEPFSIRNSRTRLCTLDPITRQSAASDFFGEENVPTQAITMGLATILEARKVLLMAAGEHKAGIIRETAEGEITDRVPASFLQDHDDATILLDRAAARDLAGFATPWLQGNIEWTDDAIKRALLWLCEQTGKALLKLDDNDFRNHNLHRLVRRRGPAARLAHRVFRWMVETIQYHPAGISKQRVLCFSPHPDDDVISMGGTILRMNDDGHEVHVAYMTSGNIAVFDHDASRVADLVTEYNRLFEIDEEKSRRVEQTVVESLANKRPGQLDVEAVMRIKGLIRWSEAKAATKEVRCSEENLHFLDLPFYRTGTVAKRPIGDTDVALICELLETVQPTQVYVAGDLSDPHGTHRMCSEAIFGALARTYEDLENCPEVLLYRGAWQEYELHEIDVAVPLSPSDLERKRKAIFMHESQKDEALFPGTDPREFWKRAEDRNIETANRYNRIGLPEYLALEAFARWNGDAL